MGGFFGGKSFFEDEGFLKVNFKGGEYFIWNQSPKKIFGSLNNEEAKKIFFLKPENYANMDLPPYIKFDFFLKNLSDEMKDKDYSGIKKDPPPEKLENFNYTLLYNKNWKIDWRPLQLIPSLFYISSLGNGITKFEWVERDKRKI